MERGPDKYKLFAKYFLEGKVCPGLAKFASSLLSSPLIMTKSWSSLQPRTETIYRSLAAAEVDSAAALVKAWQADHTFLLKAYSAWLPEVLHQDVSQLWPPPVGTADG